MRMLTAILVVVIAAACAAAPPTEPPSPPPVVGTGEDGPFTLTFSIAREAWRAGEPIEGAARLDLTRGEAAVISGSGGGPLAFEFREVDGRRRVEPASTADCVPSRIAAGQPVVSPIAKSGGWAEDDPDADFYRQFFAGPLVRLPAGEWEITAVAAFTEGADCTGAGRQLRATVRVRITD